MAQWKHFVVDPHKFTLILSPAANYSNLKCTNKKLVPWNIESHNQRLQSKFMFIKISTLITS